MADDRRDEFYVGYLPAPPRVRRFVLIIAPTLMWILLATNAAALLSMRDPGDGVWDTSATTTVTGTLYEGAYPFVLTSEGESVLFVEIGKVGGQQRAQQHGGAVTITGYPISRGGHRIIELVPGDEAIRPAENVRKVALIADPIGEVTLEGEILDAKCWLGAMKPAEGLGHRACAALCVRGGIPPAMVVENENGMDLFVLMDAERGRFPDELTRMMGRRVRVVGAAERLGSITLVRVWSVERLAG